jgi:hypothetical protein
MLMSGKKFRTLRDKKNNILTLVLSEKKFLNETKNYNPPLQVKWSVPNVDLSYTIFIKKTALKSWIAFLVLFNT